MVGDAGGRFGEYVDSYCQFETCEHTAQFVSVCIEIATSAAAATADSLYSTPYTT